ncbi:MAG: T9SS type A sorting domain-containing protein [Bacteroidia bacterium]
MKKLSFAFVFCLAINTLHAQNSSPFVLPLENTNRWNAIKLFNDTIYFSIENNIQSEGFSNRIIKVSKDLRHGIVSNFLPYGANGNLINSTSELIWYGLTQDYRNTLNGQFTVFNKNGGVIGPIIIGDTSNELYSVSEMNTDILLSGDYRPPTSQFGWSGFLARYNLDGSRIWEKYYRINRDGFRTTSFDYVFHTKNNQILVIGRSQKDSAAVWQTKVISALFDTSGNLIEIKSELDSLGWQYDFVFKIFRLPRLYYNSCVQLNDSTYGLLIYNRESQLNFPARWVFFNDKGNVISHRKAWMYRDSINNPIVADIYFKGLIKKNNGIGYFAQFLFPDSIDRHRMIELDEDLYITKVYPGIPQYSNANISAGLFAFTEDSEGNFYQLRSLNVDSISSTSTYGSLVCKIESNGKLLSNGPLFPVGLNTIKLVNEIVIYPNPTHNKVSIDCEMSGKMHLGVYSTDGKLLFKDSFIGNYQLNMEELQTGLYIFKIIDDFGNNLTKKVIRQ